MFFDHLDLVGLVFLVSFILSGSYTLSASSFTVVKITKGEEHLKETEKEDDEWGQDG